MWDLVHLRFVINQNLVIERFKDKERSRSRGFLKSIHLNVNVLMKSESRAIRNERFTNVDECRVETANE